MNPSLRLCLAGALCAVAAAASAADAPRNDYPTVDRVLYVQACMRAHPGKAKDRLCRTGQGERKFEDDVMPEISLSEAFPP